MKVEITIEVDGRLVKKHVEHVDGTLEAMEEKIHAMSRAVAGETLQASVQAVEAPRPLFLRTGVSSVTGATEGGRSSG